MIFLRKKQKNKTKQKLTPSQFNVNSNCLNLWKEGIFFLTTYVVHVVLNGVGPMLYDHLDSKRAVTY